MVASPLLVSAVPAFELLNECSTSHWARIRHEIQLARGEYCKFLEERGLSNESSNSKGLPFSSLTSEEDRLP